MSGVFVGFDGTQPTFTPGRKSITLPKKAGKGRGGGDAGDHAQQHGGGHRKDRPRISLKDRKPVHLHASSVAGAGGGNDEESGEGVNLSLDEATGQRRRIVEVRQKNQREAQLNIRRAAQVQSQASGFDTRGGQKRALIILPKNEQKMRAREMLMQMHPHISQVFRGENPPDIFEQEPFDRILQADAPCTPYRRRKMEIKTTLQWGERKLFLLELEFLTQYGLRPGTVVVYANVAPATRIPYLASLFPHIQFVLVDPNILDFNESECSNVQVRQLAFDDTIAREINATALAEGKTLLFIANATTDTPNGYVPTAEAEDYVEQGAFTTTSMDDQARWHGILKPAKSMLKFSLPWTSDSTYYLDGDIVLPVWNPPTSTEARLVPNSFHRTWSHRHYEEQMFHFNTVTRVSLHEHGVTAEGLDGCYDCTAEVWILERYLERYPHMLATAVGSQVDVIPQASQPATQLKLDTTKFRDPQWQAKQEAKKKQFLITLESENDGQPLSEAQLQAANMQFEQQQQQDAAASGGDADMVDDSAAAGASSSAAGPAASPVDPNSMMEDSPPPAAASSSSSAAVPLDPIAQLKQNIGKFSQELSRRITHGGARTLASLNEKVIAKAAFSRKNRK